MNPRLGYAASILVCNWPLVAWVVVADSRVISAAGGDRLLTKRCRDVVGDAPGLVLVIDDVRLTQLADPYVDESTSHEQRLHEWFEGLVL